MPPALHRRKALTTLAASLVPPAKLAGCASSSTAPAAPAAVNTDPSRVPLNLPEPRDPALPSLVLIGDSTVRNGRDDGQGKGAEGQWGWGTPIAAYLDPAKINVVNRAVGERCGVRADDGDPAQPFSVLGDDGPGQDEPCRLPREEGDHAEQMGAVPPGWDIAVYGLQAVENRVEVLLHDDRGRAAPRRTHSVAHEEHAVPAADVVQVDVHVQPARPEEHHASRVPTISWVSPPLSWVCTASENPAARSFATSSSLGGR